MTRRSFVFLAAGAAVVTAFPGCTREIGLSEEERQALLHVARLLYPHDALSDDVYKEALRPLRETATANRDLSGAPPGILRPSRTGDTQMVCFSVLRSAWASAQPLLD
jgi:hypothetical protein